MTKNKTILLAAGGTGGHLFPAIALAEELAKSKTRIHLITDRRCEKYLKPDFPVEPHIIDIHIRMNGFANKIKSVLSLLLACINSFFLLLKIKPDIVVGFGGYPSFPAMLAAKLLRIPIIIHEQNCFLGKSNRFFAKSAKRVALSYKETDNIDASYKSKLLITGDIVRSSIRNLPEKKSFDSAIFNIFIFGGSQGAKVFSTLIPDSIEKLLEHNPSLKLNITQQVAKQEEKQLAEKYDKLGITYKFAEFFHNMDELYATSQLVIARSGASTVAELTTVGLPAIFIPFPHSMEDHQFFNASAVAKSNASWCYRQPKATPELLSAKLNELINDRKLLENASKNLIKRKTDGAKLLADTVLKIIQ